MELSLEVTAAESLDAAVTPSLAPGEHWFEDVIVGEGQTLDLSGGPTTLNVTGDFHVAPGARVVADDCSSIVVNGVSADGILEILGDVANVCETPTDDGGDLVLRTRGRLILGHPNGSAGEEGPRARVESSGRLFIGDDRYQPRAEPTTLSYVATVEDDSIAPVCALRIATWPEDMAAMLPTTLAFEAIAADPDGGDVTVEAIDFGDGTRVEAPDSLAHDFEEGGTYEVTATIRRR